MSDWPDEWEDALLGDGTVDAVGSSHSHPAGTLVAPEPHAYVSPPNHNIKEEEEDLMTAAAPLHINSGVDGIGMWKSWTHNYEDAKFACLDLLDNCFDATLKPNFQGKVTMEYLPPNGVVIMNNSANPIKSLEETLTAYRSEKNSADTDNNNNNNNRNKDVIGEYGVGLKQACATLSDTSFVLTRNRNEFDFGIIAESLQTRNSVSLPHFAFTVGNEENMDQELHQHISQILKDNPTIHQIVTRTLGFGNRKKGIEKLVQQFKLMCDGEWKSQQHIFQLVIASLNHTRAEAVHASTSDSAHPARRFLEEVRTMLPKHYINVPLKGFEFTIEKIRVQFSYWQKRLVEMTKFEVCISKDKPVQNQPDNSNWALDGYELSIYCGFDALRVLDREKNQAKTCQLCIYSRQSGRLIEVTKDARDMLSLPSSGVDYSQGLTVIIDDAGGELPLKPTKDGLTWSKDPSGETHKSNLLAWTGAVAKVYWKYHADKFQAVATDFKSRLSEAVKSFVGPIEARQQEDEVMARKNIIREDDPTAERLENAKFTMFSDVLWTKKQSQNSMKVSILKRGKKVVSWVGPATLFKFDESHYADEKEQSGAQETAQKPAKRRGRTLKATPSTIINRKRKASVVARSSFATPVQATPVVRRRTSITSSQQNDSDSSSGDEEEEIISSPAAPRPLVTSPVMAITPMPLPARKQPRKRAPAVSATKEPRVPTVATAKTKEIELELQTSQSEVLRLKAELGNAKKQLYASPGANSGVERLLRDLSELRQRNLELENLLRESQNPQQSLLALTAENTELRQRVNQLERSLQESQHAQQSLMALQQQTSQLLQKNSQLERNLGVVQHENDRLNNELQKRDSAIQPPQGGNSNPLHWPDALDLI